MAFRSPAGALLALALIASVAGAEEAPPPRAMTLKQALEQARANHPRIAAARLRLAAAQRETEVAGANWLPRVGAFAQVVGASTVNSSTTLLGVSTVDIPRVGATPITADPNLQPYPSTAIAVGVRQQIYDFGRTAAERTAATLASEVERARVAGVALDLDFFVEQAFDAVLAAETVEAASKNAYERAKAHRDFARANVAAGMRAPIEQTRAEADVARYEAGMTRARGSVHVARAVFAAAVAVDDVELGATNGPLDAEAPLPPLTELLRHADETPNVRELRAREQAQRGETARLDAQNRPLLYGTAAVNGRAGGAPPNAGPIPPGNGWLPVVPNYDVGVVLAWPILEPVWSRRADVSREREHAFAVESQLAVRDQRAAITIAWQEADVAIATLDALSRGADAAKANYEQAEQRFKVGIGTSTELADAQALRTDAEIQLAIGRFQKARARLALGRATAEVHR